MATSLDSTIALMMPGYLPYGTLRLNGYSARSAPTMQPPPVGSYGIHARRSYSSNANAGVQPYFMEDESPTFMEQIPNSLAYLKSLKW